MPIEIAKLIKFTDFTNFSGIPHFRLYNQEHHCYKEINSRAGYQGKAVCKFHKEAKKAAISSRHVVLSTP